MRPSTLPIGLALSLALGACAGTSYVYEPASTTNATIDGRAASDYAIPPEAPRGDVRIATFGIADISPRDSSSELRALHVRLVVANNGEQAWTIDTREQRVELAHDGISAPAFATASKGSPPILTVAPRGKETVDLFFPLPPHMQKASKLPSFDVLWAVHTPSRVVVQRTPFERVAVEPAYPPSYYGYYGYYGWGGPYWYNPYYPSFGFYGAVVPPVYIQRPVTIRPHVYAPPARRVR